MKITVDWLKEKNACSEGIEYFKSLKEENAFKIFEEMIKRKENLHWANWAIVRLMEKEQFIAYAIYAAEQVIDIYETEYPKNKKTRKAIEAAKAYLKKSTEENRAAAYAAYAAANAAAEKIKMQIKILKYGIKLLKGGKR